jgi:hypothetical protein
MRIEKITLKVFLGLFLFCLQANAQISTREAPVGFKYNFSRKQIPEIVMPAIDIIKLQAEDKEEEQLDLPPRFGFIHSVDLNLLDAGHWHTLENGDKLCQLTIACPKALSINLLYDKFWLPDGAKFFVYSNDRRHNIGAFTSLNNKGNRNNIQGFATGLVYGDQVTLEYYLPNDVKEVGIISISGIVHGYRYILPEYGYGNVPGNNPNLALGFNQSGNCQVNINCPEGNNWQNEKRAVALMLVEGTRWCTGSLINNTANNFTPYFLTANHCLRGHDAISNPNLNHWTFYWNYELPPNLNDCNYNNSTPSEPLAFSTSGARIVANGSLSVSDFALLRLTEDPIYFSNHTPSYIPYYLGWDRTGNSGTGGVGIHHPRGDVKKIATYNQTPQSYSMGGGSNNYWSLYWMQTPNGYSVTEGGSSGSSLLNSNHRIIGQLYGGDSINCSDPANDYGLYGKFSVSWTGNGATDNRRRLSNWLDPNNTGVSVLNGSAACVNSFDNKTVTTNTTVKGCNNLNVETVTVTNNAKLTLNASGTISIAGPFSVREGASLEVK